MSQPWIHKYQPKSLKDIVQHTQQIAELKRFVLNYRQQRRKAALITGVSGVGKTAIVHALAHDLGLELIEINASDVRNKDSIHSIVGMASRQQSLFSKGKIILVDEIDGLSGTEDRGGMTALVDVISKSSFPVIMTARELDEQKLSPMKKISISIELPELDYLAVYDVLKSICSQEQVRCDDSALKTLARKNGGDVRAAINDLQSVAQDKKEVNPKDIEALSDRLQNESIKDALLKIFKPTNPEIALKALDSVNEDLDEAILWLDENLPKEYTKPQDLDRAYDALSRADVYRGRIRRWQHWRFMVYVEALATAGIAAAKDERYKEPIDYTRSKRILKMWMANQRYQKRKAIAQKIAEKTHTSKRRALQDTFPYMHFIVKHDKKSSLPEFLDLEKEEVEWMRR